MRRVTPRPNPLGDLLRARRQARKVGFKQLAAATGLEPETLRKWEVGETYDVPLRGVLLYAREVGITLDELVDAALASDASVLDRGVATPPPGSAEAFAALDARRREERRTKPASRRRHPRA